MLLGKGGLTSLVKYKQVPEWKGQTCTYNANYIEHDKKPHQDAFVVSSSIPGEGKDTRLLSCNQILVMYVHTYMMSVYTAWVRKANTKLDPKADKT